MTNFERREAIKCSGQTGLWSQNAWVLLTLPPCTSDFLSVKIGAPASLSCRLTVCIYSAYDETWYEVFETYRLAFTSHLNENAQYVSIY